MDLYRLNFQSSVRLFRDDDYLLPLTNLCMEKILENFQRFFLVQSWPPIVNPNIYLPLNFTEFLLDALNDDFNYKIVPALVCCLKSSENFPIRSINLTNIKALTDEDLLSILRGNSVSRLIVNSSQLTNHTIHLINSQEEHLIHLGLGQKCSNIFRRSSKIKKEQKCLERQSRNTESSENTPLLSSTPPKSSRFSFSSSPSSSFSSSPSSSSSSSSPSSSSSSSSISTVQPLKSQKFNLPNLEILCINVKHPASFSVFEFFHTASFADKLRVLDLSDCSSYIRFWDFLCFKHLSYLSLHNIILTNFEETTTIIQKLSTLKSLDIGMSYRDEPYCYIGDTNDLMGQMLSGLRQLECLEICGTNLAGIRSIQPISVRMRDLQEEAGVEWLVGRRLRYLGLLNCVDQPCIRQNISADITSGDHTPEQVVVSLQRYIERSRLLLLSLNRFFELVCNDNLNLSLQAAALEAILRGMKKYSADVNIQISGSASLFYLVKRDLRNHLSNRIKRKCIKVLLDAMQKFPIDVNIARNVCLTLCHFHFPTDLLHDYTRVVTVLLATMSKIKLTSDPFVHKVALNLLNSLACQVDRPEKLILGQLPTFEVVLQLVSERLEANKCDELMEVAWSLMWNATDETALNCEKFLEHGGLRMFSECFRTFPESEELLRNMMGLLGNVAEVHELRRLLMLPQYIVIFSNMLDSKCDGIEVSYNACGVLANLLSDGEEVWQVEGVARGEVVEKMRQAIRSWPIDSERNINYRSFKPILRLLHCTHTPVVLHWAVWALCNLTKVYREKYCPLMRDERGVQQLQHLMTTTDDADVISLCAEVVNRCHSFLKEASNEKQSSRLIVDPLQEEDSVNEDLESADC